MKYLEYLAKNKTLAFVFVAFGFAIGCLIAMLGFSIAGYEISFTISDYWNYLNDNVWFSLLLLIPFANSYLFYLLITSFQKRLIKTISIYSEQKTFIQRTTEFAGEIEKGNYLAEFTIANEYDKLGKSLISMRNSILLSMNAEKERQWLSNNLTEIGNILRNNSEFKHLGDELLPFIINESKTLQGAFYVVNWSNEENPIIEMSTCYAYARKKYMQHNFKFAEGLVGQAAVEQDILYRSEIPDTYVTVSSGLIGDKKPSHLLIVPCIANEKVYGIIELAGVQPISQNVLKMMRQAGEIIARTIFNISVNQNTLKLLSESQKLSQELEIQQKELATTNIQLAENIEEVNNSQKRLAALLERSSEIISIFEPDETIRYESPSVINILGYNPDDLIGKNNHFRLHPDDIDVFDTNFSQVLKNPLESVTFQFRYQKKDSSFIWIEATLTNLFHDTSIKGIIMNSRDITTRLLAEREQRMRGQMQALSENSHDLITRISPESKIFYINPAVNKFTTLQPKEIINKNFFDIDIPQPLKNSWIEAISEIKNTLNPFDSIVNIPHGEEELIYELKGIPEFNDKQELETVLTVAHDITEQKKIENEVKETNKKINDSINYAQRIQYSILPQEHHIVNYFSDAAMLYIPRDKVSGDFPWIYAKDDKLFVSVVDCTGHGVPGALMSLIGYFVLNEVINYEEVETPGKLLDYLHEGVKKTLKQEENKDTRDGMDVAMCMINFNKGNINYAGAHRPLLLLRNNEFIEFKGDKRPIGGIQYKNAENFTNHEFNIQKGDMIFFYSDGLPDQVGGAEGKKLMHNRIKNCIIENQQKPMTEIKEEIKKVFLQWKGAQKQLDDILLIGIRF